MTKATHLESLCARLFGLFIITAMLMASVQSVVFSHPFYQDLYASLNLAEQIGVSEEDLETSIFLMTDYVEGKRNDLEGQIVRYGQETEIFNTKEKRHMTDVRALWLKARAVMIASWTVSGLCALCLFVRKKLQAFSLLFDGLKFALLFLTILLIFFGFWCFIDFTGFWTWFHTVVFPGNMDWLLDPATDFMIVICPETMFSTMIFQIALRLIASIAILVFAGWYGEHSQKQMAPIEKELSS